MITEVDAINELGVVITSSPLLTPAAYKANVNASVPLFNDMQFFEFCKFTGYFFSNFLTNSDSYKLS